MFHRQAKNATRLVQFYHLYTGLENLYFGFPQLQKLARKLKLTCFKSGYDTSQTANINGADQSERIRRLVCAAVVHKPQRVRLSRVETQLDLFQLPLTLGFVRRGAPYIDFIIEGRCQQCNSHTFNNFISCNLQLG